MRVVIAGGGFGGVKAALELAKSGKHHITLISSKKNFQYYPALYGAATGHSHLESWVPLREIFAGVKNVLVLHDTLTNLDVERRLLVGASGKQYEYDNCILALGSVTTYFGIEGLEQYSYGIKSHEEVEEFKRHLHDEVVSSGHMDKNYVIAGAGPTGVELAAALMTYLERIRRNHQIRYQKIHISLVELAPRVLPRMPQRASTIAARRLERLGVRIMTGKKVEAMDDDSLMVSGHDIPTRTVVWTSGVANNPFFKEHEHIFSFAKNGKVVVDEHMRAAPHVYVIGDNADTPHSGLAQTALHDAHYIARHFDRLAAHKPAKPYFVIRPPIVIPVGEDWALCEWFGIIIWGWPGALLRRAADLIGYHDILPLGQALGVWRAHRITEEDCPICNQSS